MLIDIQGVLRIVSSICVLIVELLCLCRCSKELNQWDLLLDYGRDKMIHNPFLILESSWRVPDWNLMKEALGQVEASCPKEMAWKVSQPSLHYKL